MTKRHPQNELIEDVFADVLTDDLKRESLERMIAASRASRSFQRRVVGGGSALALVAFLSLLFIRSEAPDPVSQSPSMMATAVKPKQVDGTPIRVLTDEELFALFPDQAVAVVTVEDQSWFQILE